jgi:hypothetical protein
MTSESHMEGGEADVPRERTVYNRRFDGIAMGAVAIGVTLLGFLGVAYRDNQNAVVQNITNFEIRVSDQLKELGGRVRELEERVWRK